MKVIFICGPEFLRTVNRTNPFFDPIVDVVRNKDEEKDGQWMVYLSERIACGYPAEHVGNFKLFAKLGLIFWKTVHLFNRKAKPENVYRVFGHIMKPFFGRQFDCDLAITIAGYLEDEFRGMFPEKRIVDLQHGVIYSKHRGYFNEDGVLVEKFRRYKHREFWVYGPGFADCFFKNPENHMWLDGRVKVIGDVTRAGAVNRKSQLDYRERDSIVVSLQFTHDFSSAVQKSWMVDLMAVFEKIEQDGFQNRFSILMKHHPRFENSFDISPMLKRYPWLKLTDRQTHELIDCAVYHITYMSTTAFDYAASGVPTLFIESRQNRIGVEVFYNAFEYPLPLDFDEMRKALSDNTEWAYQSGQVKKWYNRFYRPFDEQHCMKLLMGQNEDGEEGKDVAMSR